MKLKTTAEKVRAVLLESPRTRDNDNLLLSKVWSLALRQRGYDPTLISASTFFKIYSFETFLPLAESIRRARQKLQQDCPELRGDSYQERITTREEETREELKLL